MIIFENEGTLDIRAVKIMGISSKDDKGSAIGYFGTGLKYAISVLLRHGATVSIITGSQRYNFSINKTTFRNDEFDIVTMNGEELGFTTELGKDWELWMAFRELYSNMLDEKGIAYEKTVCAPEVNKTYVTVEHKEFAKCYHERDDYFLNSERKREPAGPKLEILPKTNPNFGNIYYKGVRVMVTRAPALYDYNFLDGLTLTEDRTIKSGWVLAWETSRGISQLKDKRLLTSLLMATKDTYEASFCFLQCIANDFLLDVIGELRNKYKDTRINPSAIAFHKERRRVQTVLPSISCHLNNIETLQLDKAVTFCRDTLGLDLASYQLIVVKDLGDNNHLGRADMERGIMYISKQCFQEGTKRVAVAILEEYTHCHHEVLDETVAQKWVYLNQILSLGERIQGEPL